MSILYCNLQGTKDKKLLSSARLLLDDARIKPKKPTKPILHDQVTPITNPVTTPITIPSTDPASMFPTNPITPSITVPSSNPVTVPINFPATNPTPITVNPSSIPPPTTNPVTTPASNPSQSWCAAKPDASDSTIQSAIDYACGSGGVDCSAIQESGDCFNPNTLHDHASFAFNSYYQQNPNPASCNFGGAAMLVSTNPSKHPIILKKDWYQITLMYISTVIFSQLVAVILLQAYHHHCKMYQQ